MEEVFKLWTSHLASAVEAIAALVIAFAVIEATVRTFTLFAHLRRSQSAKEQIRLRLGRWLAVALEFEVAADILRTAIAPSWNELGQLAAIIVLRTVLNYFLQKEIDRAAAHPEPVDEPKPAPDQLRAA
jgi:uncharacterized membrane protein